MNTYSPLNDENMKLHAWRGIVKHLKLNPRAPRISTTRFDMRFGPTCKKRKDLKLKNYRTGFTQTYTSGSNFLLMMEGGRARLMIEVNTYDQVGCLIPLTKLQIDKIKEQQAELRPLYEAGIAKLQPNSVVDDLSGLAASFDVYRSKVKARKVIPYGDFIIGRLKLHCSAPEYKVIRQLESDLNAMLAPSAMFIDLRTGAAITESYARGDGGHSCMVGPSSQNTELYAANPRRVKLAMLMSKKAPIARCLVWVSDEDPKRTIWYPDRVYPACDIDKANQMTTALKMLAKKRGIEIRFLRDAGEAFMRKEGWNPFVVLKLGPRRLIPYVDTFCLAKVLKSRKVLLAPNNSILNREILRYSKEEQAAPTLSVLHHPTDGGPLKRIETVCSNCKKKYDKNPLSLALRVTQMKAGFWTTYCCAPCYKRLYCVAYGHDTPILKDRCKWSKNLKIYVDARAPNIGISWVEEMQDWYLYNMTTRLANGTLALNPRPAKVV